MPDEPLPPTPNRARPLLRALVRHDSRGLRERCRRRRRALVHDESVDRAIAELCEEQWAEEDLGLPLDPERDVPFYRFFAGAVGVAFERARLACVALNALPRDVRRTFFAVELAGSEASEPANERRLREARRALRRALERAPDRGGAAS